MKKLIAPVALALLLAAPIKQASASYMVGHPCTTQLGSVNGSDPRLFVNLYTGPGCTGSYLGWADLYQSSASEARVLSIWQTIVAAMAQQLRLQVYTTTSGTTLLHIAVAAN